MSTSKNTSALKTTKSSLKTVKPSAKVTKSSSSKSSSSKPNFSHWTRCSGCRTSVRSDQLPSECVTCEKISNKELFACECGNSEISVYRRKDFAPKNCIRCIFLGYQDIRTLGQETAIDQYQICDGICGLVQPIRRSFCHDCQAISYVNPDLGKQYNIYRSEQKTIARADRWSDNMWSGAFANCRLDKKTSASKAAEVAKAEAAKIETAQIEAAKAEAVKALIDEQNQEENIFRILQFAQSGKDRITQFPMSRVAKSIKTVPEMQVQASALTPAPASAPTPVQVTITLHPKNQMICKTSCQPGSLVEFPLLRAESRSQSCFN